VNGGTDLHAKPRQNYGYTATILQRIPMLPLTWTPASGFAISVDAGNDVWHAGHVADILSTGDAAIVATDTGGVWLINPNPLPGSDRYQAIPISYDWSNSHISCLAYGPDGPTQVYVGCYSPGTLFLAELSVSEGILSLQQATSLPTPSGVPDIARIGVVKSLRILVLAAGDGVYWSPIPIPTSTENGYSWTRAAGLPDGGYSGLALGPDDSVVVAAFGSQTKTRHYGIFVGKFSGSPVTLQFTRAKITGVDPSLMLRTSLAGTDADPRRLYAVSAAANDGILATFRSDDGGLSWRTGGMPQNPGNQGFYNNVIAASPFNRNLAALAWRDHVYITTDGGVSWNPLGDLQGHLHSDYHALYFPATQAHPTQLFIGSDGGVVMTNDLGKSYTSEYNKHLCNLQFTSNCCTASSLISGLIAGGSQDNGNLYLFLPSPDRPARPWITLEGGDGLTCRFIEPGQLLRFNNTWVVNGVEVGNRVRIAAWDVQNKTFSGLGTVVPLFEDRPLPTGLAFPQVLEVVYNPRYSRNGQIMYAVAGKDNVLYGLFADTTGNNALWFPLLIVDGTITALASADGYTVLIGTDQGAISLFDTTIVQLTAIPINLEQPGRIVRLLADSQPPAFAICGNGHHYVLRLDGDSWTPLLNVPITDAYLLAFDSATRPKGVYVASGDFIYGSDDNGVSWVNQSSGLPRNASISDIRAAYQLDGTRLLYAFTYGYSAFASPLKAAARPHRAKAR
jgi:hypothetical protein